MKNTFCNTFLQVSESDPPLGLLLWTSRGGKTRGLASGGLHKLLMKMKMKKMKKSSRGAVLSSWSNK